MILPYFSFLCGHRIDPGRDLVPDALVAAPVVVIVNEARDPVPQRGHVILRVQVYILPLDGPPKALYPDIIQTPGPAVHTDLDFVGCAGLQPLFTGVLASLVRVDDFWRSVGLYSPFQDLDGIGRIKRVVKPTFLLPTLSEELRGRLSFPEYSV